MTTPNPSIILYADGGCYPNPGNGCWSFVCTDPYHEECGSDPNTSSNRMEIKAVIQAINFSQQFQYDYIKVFSDSQYVVRGFNSWVTKWKQNGWQRKSHGKILPVKNVDLWKELDSLRGTKGATNRVELEWVRGHNGNEFNEVADSIVRRKYAEVFGGSMKW